MDFSSPTFFIPAIFLTLVAILASIIWHETKKMVHEGTEDLPYYYEIALSMGYIERNILESGRFIYRKNVNPDILYDNKMYNSLRHAGTLYAMYMYETLGLETKLKDQRIIASKYFINKYIEPYGENGYMVVSDPQEEGIKFPIAKSGSAGVALCALCNLYKEEEIDLFKLQGLGEFILSMQDKSNGNIYAYYNCMTKTIDTEAEAIFYPGEAAAGLLYLYEIDKQDKWLKGAKDAIMYLVRTRRIMDLNIPFDHWSVLAIEKMLENKLVTIEEANQMKAYAEQMAIPVLSNQITNVRNSYYGAFKDNIRPCSVGTIMEGLCSIYMCTDNPQLKKILIKALSIGNYFLSRVQVKTGIQAGGLPNSANWVRPDVTPNASIIRIDNVQHVVLGWLKYQQILKLTGKY
ncbi:hypothetical protein J6G99_01290 [bacterium]|nr:hypothetical protein [bacterium]